MSGLRPVTVLALECYATSLSSFSEVVDIPFEVGSRHFPNLVFKHNYNVLQTLNFLDVKIYCQNSLAKIS